jgi:DNA-binding transcriptional regulator GbsR (MarR family)
VKQFVEDVGIQFEDSGMPRMAGRIFGWLLICGPPHQSAAELAEVVEGSKGSISTMTRLLVSLRLVQRMTLAGDRHTYYRIGQDVWSEVLQKNVAKMTVMREIAERGLALIAGEDASRKQRLNEMREIHALFEQELPVILGRWETRYKKRH